MSLIKNIRKQKLIFKLVFQTLYIIHFVDKSTIEQRNVVSAYKVNKLLLKEDILHKIHKHIERISVQNVTLVYTLAKLYNMQYLAKVALRLFDSCFQNVVETENFLDLDLHTLDKILGSSNLNIHSEIEVSNQIIFWLKYKIEERSKFAEKLLHKVRLTLLSNYEMQHFLKSISPLGVTKELVETLKKVNSKKVFLTKSSCYYAARCCDHDNFDVIMCGGRASDGNQVVSCAYQIDCRHLPKKTKRLPSMIAERCGSNAVCLKGDVYLIGGSNKFGYTRSIHKYSHATETWSKLRFDMIDGRTRMCACSFIDKIFVIGGWLGNLILDSCCYFNDDGFKEVAAMNRARFRSACAVFRGKIVVSGGGVKSAESYDVFGDKWSQMPDMMHARLDHSLVVATNKLFVVGNCRTPCEVYDSTFKQFVTFINNDCVHVNKALCFGKKIFVLPNEDYIFFYDLDKDNFFLNGTTEETYDVRYYACVKVPLFTTKLFYW